MALVLLVIASVVLLPFLTYCLTSASFYRKANRKSIGNEPSTIPYLLPGIFHIFGFARTGARKYFAELIQDYGAFAPFKIRAGPRSYVVLRDPTHVSRVLNAPEHLTATTSRIEVLGKVFGSPRAVQHFGQSEKSAQKGHREGKTLGQMPYLIPDTILASTTEVYISILSANMHDKMFQYGTWTRIEDLWSFLQLVLLRCTLHTLFGSALLKEYPRVVRDYLDFDAAVEGFIPGMPRLMISGATNARNRLHQGMRTWLTTACTEMDRTNDRDDQNPVKDGSAWNERTGLQFLREHYHAYKVDKVEELNFKVRAAEVLNIIHTTNTGLLSPTFWTMVETLRQSHLTRNMTAIVRQHFSPITHKHDVSEIVQEPLIKSVLTEVQRLRTAACVVRINETDGFPLDKQWSLRKGATVTMFSHDLSINTDVWKKAQPRALERPLEEFWAERFLVPERKSKSSKGVDTLMSESSADDLGDLITRLTTCDQYPGPRFISSLQMATVAVLFAEFEIQLCETEQVDAVLPPTGKLAYGTVKPLEKIAVRIRKRKT